MKNDNKKNNGTLLIVILFIGAVMVFLFPTIHNFFYKINLPKIEKSTEKTDVETKTLTDEIISEIHRPKMRNSVYSEFTYYSLDTFKITDMTNQDILLNSFLDIYEGNIVNSSFNSDCGDVNKEFNPKYLDLRIKNILNRNLDYSFEDFYVPEDSSSSYTGNWIYKNNMYYYNGLCNYKENNIKMYDVESMIDAKYEEDDIVITYYVGFVKVINDNYTIYSNPDMTLEIGSVVGSDFKTAFENLDDKLKRKYQYRYKNTLCTYDEYCLYEGKWL